MKIYLDEKEISLMDNDVELGEYVREKLKREKELAKVEYDICLFCRKESPYTRDTHIDKRIGYIEGAGQGCFKPGSCGVY